MFFAVYNYNAFGSEKLHLINWLLLVDCMKR